MKLPKLIILDRDGVLNIHSEDEASPFYYVMETNHFIIKPNVKEALAIISALRIPTVMATKQRCIGKGLISKERVAILHSRFERLMDFDFDQIYIEENEGTKINLYKKILADRPTINPQDIFMFDDSEDELNIARRMGIAAYNCENLYDTICNVFELK